MALSQEYYICCSLVRSFDLVHCSLVGTVDEVIAAVWAQRRGCWQTWVCCAAKVPQHGGALRVAGVVVGNWKSNKEDSYVKVVDHLTARSAPPLTLQPPSPIAAITYVSTLFIHFSFSHVLNRIYTQNHLHAFRSEMILCRRYDRGFSYNIP